MSQDEPSFYSANILSPTGSVSLSTVHFLLPATSFSLLASTQIGAIYFPTINGNHSSTWLKNKGQDSLFEKKNEMKINLWLYALSMLLVALFATKPVSAQSKFTLSGYVKDAFNGEALIGVTVYIPAVKNGTISNVYGFYSLSVPPGTYELEFNYIGHEKVVKTVNLTQNTTLDIELKQEDVQLNEVVIVSEAADKNVNQLEMGTHELDINTIKKMPSLLGEVEILRGIQLLPGVSTVGEGASGFNVRGGSIDQNLVLLDEAPVYNSSHLFGFFSVFNPDAVKDVKLFKGNVPARYGGRLSSILDVRMKEGNSKRLAVNGGVGLIFSRLAIEGPIAKDKASFIVAGRRSYADVLAQPFLNDDLSGTRLNFYDLTLKANYRPNAKNQLFLSGYLGRDNFFLSDVGGFSWGNQTVSARWNHLFSEKLFSNFTAYYSNYDYELKFGDNGTNRFDWNAQIVTYGLKSDLSWFINPDNKVRFGGQLLVYEFEPGNAIGVSEGEVANISVSKKYALEGGVYVENELTVSNRLSFDYGLRLSYFNYTGEGNAYFYEDNPEGGRKPFVRTEEFDQWESIQDYFNLEPRASFKYSLSPKSSIKASYARTAQYIHLISNTTAATPVDVWTPSTNNLKPQMSNQFSLGYFRNFNNNQIETSIEVYYKEMDHLVEYIEGADLVLNEFIEGDLLDAEGRAYGVELLVEKKNGPLTGWLSYTLSRSERQTEGINDGEWFPSRFDQTHNFSLAAFYELNKRWTFSASWVFNSGTPTTFPTSRYYQQGYLVPQNASNSRNNVRLPDYHRLDISATLNGKDKPEKRWKSQWVFSVYNLYNRRNPFDIFFRQQQIRPTAGQPITSEAIRLSVIGSFVPSVSYNFNF